LHLFGRKVHAVLVPQKNESALSKASPANTFYPILWFGARARGRSPAIIHLGDTYADLGATITAPDADKNLGLKYFLNGTLVSNIVIDTSKVATDTIDYVVTDPAGLTATTTRTVIIEAAAPPPAAAIASSSPVTVASSTAQ
jgi:Domain of unknown function (DUF5011)